MTKQTKQRKEKGSGMMDEEVNDRNEVSIKWQKMNMDALHAGRKIVELKEKEKKKNKLKKKLGGRGA